MQDTSEARPRDLRVLGLGAAILVLAVSLTVLFWGIWPGAREQRLLLVSPTQMTLPRSASHVPDPAAPSPTPAPGQAAGQTADTLSPTIPEYRRLLLEFPARMRTGDPEVISLTFEVDPVANPPPSPATGDNHVTASIEPMQSVFESHNVVAEAEVDLPGLVIRPPGPVREPLLPRDTATFRWSLLHAPSGTYRGTAWLFLIFVDRTTGEQSRKAIAAQSLQIEARTFMGLTGESARVAGGIACIVGSVLALPFAGDVVKWFRSPTGARGH